MVCNRCKAAVNDALETHGLHPVSIQLGEVVVSEEQIATDVMQSLEQSLKALGFEIIDDKKTKIIEKIKSVVINIIHHSDEQPRYKYSDIITAALHYDYTYLSKLFSEVEGTTIEHYIINQKIERIKELLVYNEMNLSEIADSMGYSSVAHLSAQFKKITGLPPSHFKNIGAEQRKPLDKV